MWLSTMAVKVLKLPMLRIAMAPVAFKPLPAKFFEPLSTITPLVDALDDFAQ